MSAGRVRSGAPWEERFGYSRAVRTGDRVLVGGTTATNPDGSVEGEDDAYTQARRCFAIIGDALEALGSSLGRVVRTRMYVVRIEDAEAVGRAHREAVGEAAPAATMVQVAGLIDPRHLVEIEVEALAGDR